MNTIIKMNRTGAQTLFHSDKKAVVVSHMLIQGTQ